MRIAHIFAHSAANAGDIYLKKATQLSFLTVFPQATFSNIEMRKIYKFEDLIFKTHSLSSSKFCLRRDD